MKHSFRYSILALLFLCITSASVFSQTPSLWIGARVGANIASLNWDPAAANGLTTGSKTGLILGGELDYWLSDMIAIGAQANYVQKGGTEDQSADGFSFSGKLNFNYLQIPVLFKARFGTGSIKPVVFIGPAFGFKLSASESMSSGGHDTTIAIADSELVSTNLSVLIGAGLSLDINPDAQIFLDVAYDYGLTNLNAHYGSTSDGETDNQKIYSRDFRVTAGIRFGLGK